MQGTAGPRDEGGQLLCFTAGGDSPGPHRDRDPDSPGPHEPRDHLGLGSGRREEWHRERLPRGREEAERPPVAGMEQGPGAEGAPGAGAAALWVPGGAEGSAEGQPPGRCTGDRGCLASPLGEGGKQVLQACLPHEAEHPLGPRSGVPPLPPAPGRCRTSPCGVQVWGARRGCRCGVQVWGQRAWGTRVGSRRTALRRGTGPWGQAGLLSCQRPQAEKLQANAGLRSRL